MGRRSNLGFSHLGGRSRRPLSAAKRRMIVGKSALAMFAGDWAFASIPSGAFFCGSWMAEDGKELCMVGNCR
jgi:hypothetical protein